MEIVLIFMMLWCAVLLWCIFQETARNVQFVLTVICLSGGILFFSWYLIAGEFFAASYHRWHQLEEIYPILFSIIVFLLILYIARVIGTRIDNAGK